MAYQRKAPPVHAFKRIQKDLKEDQMKNILLFYGREDYLIRWSADRVKERFINPAAEVFDYMRLDGAECTAGDIRDACETMPMMSERRMVVVQGFRSDSEGAEELEAYFQNFPDSTVLVLMAGEVDRRRKLYKTIQKQGAEYEFDHLDSGMLNSFIIKNLRNSGRSFDPDVPGMIAEASGYYDKDSSYTLDNLVNDLSKIVSHSGDRITVQDVEETIAGNEARDVFAFADALAAGRKGEALQLLSVLLSYGENEFKLLGLICSQFEVLLLVREMQEEGLSTAAMHSQTGIHEFRIKKSLPLARQYTVSRLRHILMKAYEVDRNVKSGSLEARAALELFVAMV